MEIIKENYERIRPGSNFDVTISNIERTARLIEKYNSKTVLEIHYIVTRENQKFLEGAIDLCANIGVQNMFLKPVVEFLAMDRDEPIFFKDMAHHTHLFPVFAKMKSYASTKGIQLNYPEYIDLFMGNLSQPLDKILNRRACQVPFFALHPQFWPRVLRSKGVTGKRQYILSGSGS